ncbi:MAG: geranylgeranylglycerol-phosphate geranylgeranyltransferase [Ignavibacteriales bacterium]|nr:geranylgeranylglycerol-phosphate geranylgeranyltransferase [Ignavibacteriales bacterium]
MVQFRAVILLLRPVNVCITGLVVFSMILLLSESPIALFTAIFASAAAAITAAAGNIINDITDIPTDKTNHPSRPLVTGVLSVRFAMRLYVYLVVLSIGISLLLPHYLFIFVAVVHVLLFLYSVKLQYIILGGNVLIAVLTASAFIFAGIAAGNVTKSMVPALFGFLINLMREIVKDTEDMDGDKLLGTVTIPLRFGVFPAFYMVLVLGILLIATTWLPFFLFPGGIFFTVTANLFVNPLIVLSLKHLYPVGENTAVHKAGSILKLAMFLGLGAIGLWI